LENDNFCVRNAKVRGSIPLGSTNQINALSLNPTL